MPNESRCTSCSAKILWVNSATSGRPMPLNAEPRANGNIVIIDGVGHVIGDDLMVSDTYDGPRYVSHFSTCPWAEKHRKRN